MIEKVDNFEGIGPSARTVKSGRPPLDIRGMNDARWILRAMGKRTDARCYVLLRGRSVYPEVIVAPSETLADVFSITFHPSGNVEISGGVEDVPSAVIQAASVVGNTDVVPCAMLVEGRGTDDIEVVGSFEAPPLSGEGEVAPLIHITGEMNRKGMATASVRVGDWTLYLFSDMDELKRSIR